MSAQPIPKPAANRSTTARIVMGLVLAAAMLGACAAPTPAVVVQTQIVQQTVQVQQTVPVQQTVQVQQTVEQTVEVPVVVTATPGPASNFTLRAAHYAKWDTFNPLIGQFGGNLVDIAYRVFSALTAQDPTGKIFGDLASSWDVSQDGMTYTFHLRPNVKFHDGVPLTSKDIVFTFAFADNPKTGSIRASSLERIVGAKDFADGTATSISGIKAVDDQTVEFDLTAADAYFLVTMAGIPIFPEHILGSMKPEDIAKSDFSLKSPIGTGPYKLVSFDPVNQVVKFDAYQDYHFGAPKIPHVTWVWIAKPEDQLVAFQKQEIDYAPWDVWNEGHYKTAIGIPTLQSIPIAWGQVGGIVINASKPYFADTRVRQAIFYAIDRHQFLSQSGYDKLYTGYFDLASWARNPAVSWDTLYPYNPDKAKQLLQQAGWDPNREVVLYTTVTGADPQRLAIQQMLGAVGMKVKLQQVEVAAVDKAMNQDRPPTYDLYITGLNLNDPGLAIATALRCNATGNFFGYCNKDLDALSQQDQSATSVDARVPILQKMEAMMAADPVLIPLTYAPQYVGFSNKCTIQQYAWYTFQYMQNWTCNP